MPNTSLPAKAKKPSMDDVVPLMERATHVGIWEMDLLNPEAPDAFRLSDETRKIYGIEKDVLLTYGKILSFVHSDDIKCMMEAHEAATTSGKQAEIEHRFIRSDGEERTVHISSEI